MFKLARPISLHFTRSLDSNRDRRARKGSFDLLTTHALRSNLRCDADCEGAREIVFIVQLANKPLSIVSKYQQEYQASILTFTFCQVVLLCLQRTSRNKTEEVAVGGSLVVRKVTAGRRHIVVAFVRRRSL